MSEKLIGAIGAVQNVTTTTNGAVALKSTNSALVDLFGSIGAMRNRTDADLEAKFIAAMAEDQLLATKMAFYARNVRGGLGERKVFRIILKHLATVNPDIVRKNLANIAHFGRFDDLYVLIGTAVEADVWGLIRGQWTLDMKGMGEDQPISVMAKWLKSVNTSSADSVRLGKATAKALRLTEKQYRKALARLRAHIDVVERKMSSGQWEDIKYPAVPSRAMKIYNKAFVKHDETGFTGYIESVKKGEAKINASTLYPYDILESMRMGAMGGHLSATYDEVAEQQWKALPNYIEGEHNVLVMSDTSASMRGRPLTTAVGLAVYFAERNKGVFKDTFMTFSTRPELVTLTGATLYEKIKGIRAIVSDTNLEAAFRLILETAVNHGLTQDDMPKSLVVISDMQFNNMTVDRGAMTWYDNMREQFAEKGFEIPNVIFWNVNSPTDSFQVTSNYKGVQLASGQSASTFKSILANIGFNPYEAMVNTLSDPAYDCVTV